jgi:filamentous hemagglutinin family protein
LTIVGAIARDENSALAQLIPDNTLGAESSVVNQIDELNERIDGGAIRGANLFHSFQEFNVGEGKGVYFANPEGIANILSRVTGGNPSHILGRLGVLGGANLFLLNPNGILFGSHASLDIQGSFVATTADGIQLGENGFFSATDPAQSRLLSVNPGVLFFNQVATTPGAIVNRGDLAVGKDLTLSAGNLDLQGQLYAGGNLTLQALEALRIRDSAANPFIASARGNLLVQGNQSVDIFALNHPQSGLFSGEEMVLRSANPVGGDAHFGSGGNFRIEKLDGSFGGLFSPNASAIRANGDVAFAFYEGASLHILAGGSVTIPGYVWIQGTDPVNGIVENVTLSDGTIVSINSRLQPTLDIRAGTTALGTPLSNTRTPTSADIDIGTIFFADAAGNPVAGTVLLTNQYQSNLSLNGNIQISATQEGLLTGIASRTRDFESGGLVAIDSKGGITVNGRILASAAPVPSPNPDFSPYFYLGNGGDVTLLANGDINFPPGSGILSDGLLGGNIILKSDGTISLNGAGITSRSFSTVPDSKGGKIDIAANSFSLTGGSPVISSTWGKGNAGDINIDVNETVSRPKSSAIAHRKIPIKLIVVKKTVLLDTFFGTPLERV